jgi:hypothetical protein
MASCAPYVAEDHRSSIRPRCVEARGGAPRCGRPGVLQCAVPTHPLFVHVPIVIVPLLALATIFVALGSGWRARWGTALIVGQIVMLGYTSIFVMRSGEFLAEAASLEKVAHHHEELAETTRLLQFLMLVATGCIWGQDRINRRAIASDNHPAWLNPAGYAIRAAASSVAVLTVVWMWRTGHAGAEITYTGVLPTN